MIFSNRSFDSWYDLIKAEGERKTRENFDRSIDFDSSKSDLTCLQAAAADIPCCFLIKAGSNPRTPTLVHSPLGVFTRKEDGNFEMRAAIHSGVLASMAQVLEIDQEEFFDPIDENERNFEDLVKCKNLEDFETLRGQRNKKVNCLRRAIFIPNDLAVKFIDSSCTSTWEVFELFSEESISTEINEEGVEVSTVKECDYEYLKSILHWLALFDTEVIGEINFKSCLDDDTLVTNSKTLHYQHLKRQTENSNQVPSGVGDQSESANMTVYQQKHLQLLQEQSEHLSSSLASNSASAPSASEENKSRGFDKLPSITKATILAFLSVDGESPALDIDQVGKDIFMGRNDYEKTKILEVHLRREGIMDVTLSIAQSKDLVNGHWTWKNSNTPSGFSFVLFSRSDPLSGLSTSDEIRYLSLKTKKEIDNGSLKKLTESDITIPSDEHGILACIQTGTACLKCFKQDALIVRNLERFLSDLHLNKYLIRIACLKDKSFPTAFLCAVDRRVCSYLSQCEVFQEDMASIPSELISFNDIILRLQQGTFIFTDIPSAIKSTRPHSPPASPDSKRQKPKQKENRVVQNGEKDPDLLCASDDDYGKIYGKATMVHLRPRNVCTRWNIKGYCFQDCNNSKYHCKPSAEKKRELLEYMRKCKPISS